jgi:hypothetical protein
MFDKIASLLGGNLFTGAAEIIGKFVTDPTKLMEAQAELTKLQANTEMKLAELAVQDRNSARQREMAVKDWTPSLLGWTVLAFWGLGNYYVFTHALPVGSETLIARVLGTIDMAVGLVLGYYFGSSAGSSAKSDTINSYLSGK